MERGAIAAMPQQKVAAHQANLRMDRTAVSGRPFEKLLWGLTIFGTVLGLIQLIHTVVNAECAPQQATGTGVVMGLAVIPPGARGVSRTGIDVPFSLRTA